MNDTRLAVLPAAAEAVTPQTAQDERYREMEERLRELEYLLGLLLEFSHDMMNDIHAPKARWERQMLPVWKAHIERKKKVRQDATG